MVQVKSFCNRYSLRTGSIFILCLYLILVVPFFIAEIVNFTGPLVFASVTELVLIPTGIIFVSTGLLGVFAERPSLLVPILFLKLIYFVISVVLFIYFLFEKKLPLPKTINDLAQINHGVFGILFPASLGLSAYFWIVIHSYYMKELKEGTARGRSET